MKLNENSETKKSSRGWEWTEDERDAIKPLKRKLEKQYNSVKKMVSGLPKTIPEFAKDAEMYGKPYLESAKEIISLDSRRKGRKWQSIPYKSLPEKIKKTAELYAEYKSIFLSREDFQKALKDYNKGIQKKNREIKKIETGVIEKVIENNLEYINELKSDKTKLESNIQELMFLFRQAAILKLRSKGISPDIEDKALNDWIMIQYIDIASRQNDEIIEFVKNKIEEIEQPSDLLNDVHLLVVENEVKSYNARIRKMPSLIKFPKPNAILGSIVTIITNTIVYRLDKELDSDKEILPFQLKHILYGKKFDS